jgi:hypothetical protein
MIRPLLITLSVAPAAIPFPLRADVGPDRDHHSLRSRGFGDWAAELQIGFGVRHGRDAITGLLCALRGDDGVTLTLTRPVETGQFLARFEFDIERDASGDADLIDSRVVRLGIGSRSYEYNRIQWRLSPAFLGWEPPDPHILLPYGLELPAFRVGEGYPWLPVEYLIPSLMEVEALRLSYRGDKEIAHGNYRTVYRERTVRMHGFREAMAWCGDALRSETSVKLPEELKHRR